MQRGTKEEDVKMQEVDATYQPQRRSQRDQLCQLWWLIPVIPATWEAEIWRVKVQGQSQKKC
jgi:hypothetical protein